MGIQQMVLGADAGIGAQLAGPYDGGHIEFDPFNATAGFKLTSGGRIMATDYADGSYIDYGAWLVSGVHSDFEARATMLTGSLSSGTAGSWLLLSTDRTWTKNRTTIGYVSCSFTIEIRRVSDSVVLATTTVTLEAEVN